jgi:hypothetical protein
MAVRRHRYKHVVLLPCEVSLSLYLSLDETNKTSSKIKTFSDHSHSRTIICPLRFLVRSICVYSRVYIIKSIEYYSQK